MCVREMVDYNLLWGCSDLGQEPWWHVTPFHILRYSTQMHDERPKCIEPSITDKPVAMMHPSMLMMRPKSNGV